MTIFVIVCLGLLAFMIWRGMAGSARLETEMSTVDVVSNAVQVMTMKNWTVSSQTPTAVTFTRRKKPNWLTALVLLLFLLIPGIVYLVLAGKTFSFSVSTRAADMGKTSVQIAWNRNSAGRGPAAAIQRLIPIAPVAVSVA